jgi:hypothetical protein
VGGVASAVGVAAAEAWNTPAGQVAAGVATGGLSVAVQFIPGVGGPTEAAIQAAVKDPGGAITSLPGLALQVGPGPLAVALVQAGARGAGALGLSGGEQVANLVAGVGEAERKHPEQVAALVGGTALIATGIGTAAGVGLVTGAGVGLGGAALEIAVARERKKAPPPPTGKGGKAPPPPPLPQAEQIKLWAAQGGGVSAPPPPPPGFKRLESGGLRSDTEWPGLVPWLRELLGW